MPLYEIDAALGGVEYQGLGLQRAVRHAAVLGLSPYTKERLDPAAVFPLPLDPEKEEDEMTKEELENFVESALEISMELIKHSKQ